MIIDSDILIVGGGPIGSAFALALRASGLDVTLLEARDAPSTETRTLALSYGSRLLLEKLGAWPDSATPITAIHVSEREAFGRTLLMADELDVPALGYVLTYSALQAALDNALKARGIKVLRGARAEKISTDLNQATVTFTQNNSAQTIHSKLLVLADGGNLLAMIPDIELEEKDYGQQAILARVQTELPHHHLAYERFTPNGPAALLPFEDRYSLVWTESPEEVVRLLTLNDADFLVELHQHFGDRQGRFTEVSARKSFPLKLRYAKSATAQRVALIGNAAQALHPVAGQGFNLGMRDANALAKIILVTAKNDLGSDAMLAQFADARKQDKARGIDFTDKLVNIFSNKNNMLRVARSGGLALMDLLPPARKLLTRKMIFGASSK
ncbi:MAG: FAD-dependent oxidoreductase [Burkholderiales bacterium]